MPSLLGREDVATGLQLNMDTGTVYVVDDDPAAREAVVGLAQSMGLHARAFATPQDFLREYDGSEPGCLVLEVRMPGMSGLDLQQQLAMQDQAPPIIFVTAYGDVTVAVTAMKAGAVDFLEKPFRSLELWKCIQAAIAQDAARRSRRISQADLRAKLDRLTPGERAVLDRLVEGHSKQSIAAELKLSIRTIEVRRAKLMRKLQAKSLAELVRTALAEQLAS